MRPEHKRLRALPARTPEQIVAALASVSAEQITSEGNLPVATLHLASGRDLTGCVLGLVEHRGMASAVMQTGSTSRHDPGSDATYVGLASVAAVTVHDAAVFAELLAGGPLQLGEPPPTRLAARRSIAEDSSRLNEALGAQLAYHADIDGTAEGEPMRALAAASRLGANALIAVAADTLGRQALADVREVKIAVSGAPSAQREAHVLWVTADDHVTPAALLAVIEAAL